MCKFCWLSFCPKQQKTITKIVFIIDNINCHIYFKGKSKKLAPLAKWSSTPSFLSKWSDWDFLGSFLVFRNKLVLILSRNFARQNCFYTPLFPVNQFIPGQWLNWRYICSRLTVMLNFSLFQNLIIWKVDLAEQMEEEAEKYKWSSALVANEHFQGNLPATATDGYRWQNISSF